MDEVVNVWGVCSRVLAGDWAESRPQRAPSAPFVKSWWARIPVPGSCWLLLLLETHTHSPMYALHSNTTQTNINTDAQYTHSHTKVCSFNWKLHSGCGLCENVGTHFFPLHPPLVLDLMTSAPTALQRFCTGGYNQLLTRQGNNDLLLMQLYHGAQW